jgi:hypothetical protein
MAMAIGAIEEATARIEEAAAEAEFTRPLDIWEATAKLERAKAQAPTMIAYGDKVKIVFTLDGVCRVCGCNQHRGCPGGCVWAEPNLCSRCALGRPRRPRP